MGLIAKIALSIILALALHTLEGKTGDESIKILTLAADDNAKTRRVEAIDCD